MLRDGLRTKSGGRIDVQVSSDAERSLGGQEVLRLVRAGQVDIGASPLSTVSGDVPFLDGVDLAGLHPEITLARKVADALVPLVGDGNIIQEKLGIPRCNMVPATSASTRKQWPTPDECVLLRDLVTAAKAVAHATLRAMW